MQTIEIFTFRQRDFVEWNININLVNSIISYVARMSNNNNKKKRFLKNGPIG